MAENNASINTKKVSKYVKEKGLIYQKYIDHIPCPSFDL